MCIYMPMGIDKRVIHITTYIYILRICRVVEVSTANWGQYLNVDTRCRKWAEHVRAGI